MLYISILQTNLDTRQRLHDCYNETIRCGYMR